MTKYGSINRAHCPTLRRIRRCLHGFVCTEASEVPLKVHGFGEIRGAWKSKSDTLFDDWLVIATRAATSLGMPLTKFITTHPLLTIRPNNPTIAICLDSKAINE
ncbi:hypothetical protein FCULG_00010629 [Fusarium culmorum]|uniref:Uncharacterized protein n=1 Tax=Fusarium culmorum TaxID=5516 RepID=A0A2T4GCR0_FUSCU|nr:hypothetical protein FCULG_00010629 [Fusarium culmorum]